MEPVLPAKRASPADHLANERTFLAWIRTSIALMGFGFVIVKFALFLKQIGIVIGDKLPPQKGYSAMIGVGMVGLGAILAIVAYFHYRKTEKQLDQGSFASSKTLSLAVTSAIIVASILMIVYLLSNI